MLALIIAISVLIVISFFTILVSGISLIAKSVRKKAEGKKSSKITLIASSVLFLAFIGLNVYFIINYVYNNRVAIVNKTVESGAEVLSKGLALTVSNLEKNWDRTLIKKFEKLEISILKTEVANVKDGKKYKFDLFLNNTNPMDIKIYMHDLFNNNYLVVCDKDDFVYLFGDKKWQCTVFYQIDAIPVGKSKASFEITLPKDVNLDYIRFMKEKIQINKL
jgi:hypothetical protein